MKKNFDYIAMICFCFLTIFIFYIFIDFRISQNNNQNPYEYTDMFDYHLIAILQQSTGLNESLIIKAINKASNDFNVAVEIFQVESPKEQIDLINTAVLSKVDGIIISPIDGGNYNETVNAAEEAGVHVITVGTDITASRRTAFIGTSEQSGYIIGSQFLNVTNGEAYICILTNNAASFTYNDRILGFKQALIEHENVRMVIKEVKRDIFIASKQIIEVLEENERIDSFLCLSPNTLAAAVKAVDSSDRKPLIIGYDGYIETLDLIKKGKVYGTIMENSSKIGYFSIEYMKNILLDEQVSEFFDPGANWVTKDNVDDYYSEILNKQ